MGGGLVAVWGEGTHGKEHHEPGGHDGERDGGGIGEAAVVEIEVVEEADLLVGAVFADELALVGELVDAAALGGL